MHLRSLDLNLLTALDALLRERHVTRAAKQVGLSQSAMSHALARLREHLADPLLVKSSRGMQPTERALALQPLLQSALGTLERALAPLPAFDPREARRTFHVCASDYETLTFVEPLLNRLRAAAAGVNLRLYAPRLTPVADALARGDLDLVIKPLSKVDVAEGIYHQRLMVRERFVVIARRGNPHVGKKLTLQRYVRAPHALVAPGESARGKVDEMLEERGLSRRVLVTVPHFLVAPHLVANTDLLLTIPERVALRFAPLLQLQVHALPVPLAGFSIHQLWHARTHADSAHQYLRQQLSEVAAAHRE